MAPPPPPLPPELPEDAVGDILLRLPPDDPASLVRASLVCKPWRRIFSDPDFSRRYRAFHRRPPLLGFFYNSLTSNYKSVLHFVPTTAPSPFRQPALGHGNWRVLDCRHGRVLFDISNAKTSLVVWDPVTGNQHGLPEPSSPRRVYTAAVLCAVRGCDHLDCHGGPFFVVLVVVSAAMELQAHQYSSESGSWHASAHLGLGYIPTSTPSVLIEDDIYFKVAVSNKILRYELGSNCLSIIEPPTVNDIHSDVSLVSMENGSLGMTFVSCLKLSLWSMDVDQDGVAGWVQFRVIELENLSNVMPCHNASLAGSVEGFGIILVDTDVGIFTIELKSGMVKKVAGECEESWIYPFVSFYTPDCANRKLPSLAGAH